MRHPKCDCVSHGWWGCVYEERDKRENDLINKIADRVNNTNNNQSKYKCECRDKKIEKFNDTKEEVNILSLATKLDKVIEAVNIINEKIK